MGAVISRLLYEEKKWGKYGALLLLPNEVLCDVFKFLNRRQLTNLERVCLRFHRIISAHMDETPFHRLRLPIGFEFCARLQTYIYNEGKVTFVTDLENFYFLRFNSVFLIYEPGSQSIDEKLQLLQNRLQLFKTAFSDLGEITLSAKINQNDQSQFHDHSQLLDHIREQLLPICDSSPVYSFQIDFQSDNDGAGDFIAQILQMRPIARCREVLFRYANETFIQLPVEVISNWLHRNSGDGIGCTGTGQSNKELILAMNNNSIKIQNAVEICDHLKMAFNDSNSPVHPFAFCFDGGPVERELIENEKTNENLFINCRDSGEDGMTVLIERSAKETKNSQETE